MTETRTITEGEAFAWAIPVVDEDGDPLDISAGSVEASAKALDAGGALVAAAASFGDSYTVHAGLAAGALAAGLWRVQTWLTLAGEPQLLAEFNLAVRVKNA